MSEQKKHLLIEIGEDLHSKIKIKAAMLHTSIKNYVVATLKERLEEDEKLK